MDHTAKRMIAVVTALPTLIGLLAFALYHGLIRFNYPSLNDYPVQGVVLRQYHWQQNIEWSKLPSQSLQFALLEAPTIDHVAWWPQFNQAQEAARLANVATIPLLSFDVCQALPAQLAHYVPVISHVSQLAVDIQIGAACQNKISLAQMNRLVMEIIQDSRLKNNDIVLFNTGNIKNDNATNHGSVQWLFVNTFNTPKSTWDYWLYADKGRVDGIAGTVALVVKNKP